MGQFGDPLSELEQTILLSRVDATFLRSQTVNKIFQHLRDSEAGVGDNPLGKISQSVGKVPKRGQSELAVRDIELNISQIEKISEQMYGSGKFGDTLELTDITEIFIKKIKGAELTASEKTVLKSFGQGVKPDDFVDPMDIIGQVSGYVSADGTISDPNGLLEHLKNRIMSIDFDENKNFFEQLSSESELNTAKSMLDPALRDDYERLVKTLPQNLEPMRDGAVVITETFVRRLINQKKDELDELEKLYGSGTRKITLEEMEAIKNKKNEIKKLKHALNSGNESDHTVRIGIGETTVNVGKNETEIGGSIKARAGILRFEDYEENIEGLSYNQARKKIGQINKRIRELERIGNRRALTYDEAEELTRLTSNDLQDVMEKFQRISIIGDVSAIKKETGTAPFFGMNISMKSAGQVYAEPMELMSEPTIYTDPIFLESQKKAIEQAQEKIQTFLKTGVLPDEVLSNIDELGDMTSEELENLTPLARATAFKRRQYLAEINRVIRLGLPLSDSIEAIQFVTTHFAKNAFTLKDDVPSLVKPSDERFKIRVPATQGSKVIESSFNQTGHDIIPIKPLSGSTKSRSSTFVQMAIRGKKILIANQNSTIYKSVLSGFDQDDDAIVQLRTFEDADGKIRFGQRIVRDPKSSEETFFARFVLDDAETLQGLLGKNPETISRLQDQFEDKDFVEGIMKETGVDESTAKKVFDRLKQTLAKNGKRFVEKGKLKDEFGEALDESSLFVIETVVRKAKEMERGSSLQSFQSESEIEAFNQAAEMRSASPRAANAMVLDSSGNLTTQKIARNLSTEQAGPYTTERMIQITTKAGVDPETGKKILEKINADLTGKFSPLTMEEVLSEDFLDDTIPNFKGIPFHFRLGVAENAVRTMVNDTVIRNFGETLESIGNLVNAGAFVDSISPIMKHPEIIEALEKSGMSPKEIEALKLSTTVPVEPRSNIVDIINQSMGDKSLTQYSEAIKSLSAEEIPKLQAAYTAIAEQVQRRTGIPTTFENIHENVAGRTYLQSDAAKAAISQQLKMLGAIRARQLANNVSDEQLIGIDPVVLDRRLSTPQFREEARRAVVESYESALSSTNIDAAAKSRIRSELDLLKSNVENLSVLALRKGSDLYKKFAATAVQADLATSGRAAIAASSSARERMLLKSNLPSAKSEYIKAASAMLEKMGISKDLDELKNLTDEDQVRILKASISEKLSIGIKAIQKNYAATSSTTLDIVDGLESELRTNFGSAAARLLGGMGEPDAEHEMMELFNKAKSRRQSRRALRDPMSYGIIQRAFRTHVGDATAKLESVDQNYAKRFLEYQSRLAPDSPEKAMSQDLMDFMEATSLSDLERNNSKKSIATRAIAYMRNKQNIEQLEADPGLLPTASTSGLDAEDFGGSIDDLADDIAKSVAETGEEPFELSRTNYKRVGLDIFKSKKVRTGAAAAVALIGASFLYQSKKTKDRTEQDLQGPPLLPGGNPYETSYPTRQAVINQIQQNQVQSSGMQYQINTSGSIQDLNKLRGLFGDVVDGPINSTMYNGLPTLGQDPYSDIASRF